MVLFAATVFLSAFLLFMVQPLIARVILPWFGGSAAVWTTCLMFFQVTLLAGYAYAHASVRFLRPKGQATLHLILLAASVAMLPIWPGAGWKPADGLHPSARIFALLAATVGIPYLLLSTTGPLTQAWFARQYKNRSPYQLYALSNAGSLMALVSYPVVIEPLTRLRPQAYAWSAAYGVFAILIAALAIASRRAAVLVPEGDAAAPVPYSPRVKQRLLWAALAFCPSMLVAAVSSHMTENIAPVPLLWVAVLALYLLSFILTFESDRWYGRRFWFPLFVFAVAFMLAFLFPAQTNFSPKYMIPLFLTGFFVCAVVCHGELYRLRPPPGWLTSFYLMVALGGALGGIFVALVAPAVFKDYIELPAGLLITVTTFGLVVHHAKPALPGPAARYIEYALVGALGAGLLYLLVWEHPHATAKFTLMKRNFYGALRVTDIAETEETEPMRELQHGSIIHGSEFLREAFHRRPTTYYSPASGIGLALADRPLAPPRKVAVIGLGTGTISAYARPEDTYRFYEINPLVVEIAKSQFYYLKECAGHWDVVLGDARLSLERDGQSVYDVLAVDAFSGDSVPVHLLTLEAFREYFRHLKKEGVLAVHVSNKYLALGGVVARAAQELGKSAALIVSTDDDSVGAYKSDWIVLVSDPAVLRRPEWKFFAHRDPLPKPTELWTDDYSNLFRILK